MKQIILDIESRPNPKLEEMFFEGIKAPKNIKDKEKIKSNIEEQKKGAKKDMAVDIDYSEIICIGVRDVGGESKQISLEEFSDILEDVSKGNARLITYNGKNFDIPILVRACLKFSNSNYLYNVRFLNSLRNKYNISSYHIDLFEELNNFGKWKSLDELCRIYVGGGKEDIDFNTATDEEIKKHNLECLSMTEKLYKFFEPIL